MKILLMGDSTMAFNDYHTFPQTGWGQMFTLFVSSKVKILNYAHNGCSTKSFIDQGRFKKVLEAASSGDICFIQFAHNDEKINDPSRYCEANTAFKDNLNYFIKELKGKNVEVILLTPICRRIFENGVLKNNTHLNYPKVIIETAINNDLEYVDVCSKTRELLTKLDDEASKPLYMFFSPNIYDNFLDGSCDNTHLSPLGAYKVCQIIVDDLKEKKHMISKYFL